MTFAEFQSAVGAWSRKNFPDNTPDNPFEGLVEEAGELAHARLKARQGIRGTAEEHEAAEKDAIGDLAIYDADWCERNGFGLADGLADCFEEPFLGSTFADLDDASRRGLAELPDRTADRAFRNIVVLLGEIAGGFEPLDNHPAMILGNLAVYCTLRGWSLAEVVEETWGRVKQRDWRANPQGPSTEALIGPAAPGEALP